MTRLDELGRHIAREQDALRARSSVRADVRKQLDTLELPEQPARGAWARAAFVSAAAGAVAAGLAIAFWPTPATDETHALEVAIGDDGRPGAVGTWVEASSAKAVAMRFSDGTRVDVAPDARARIAELDARGAHLLLESGLAQVQVQPRENAHWRISAGPFAVKVTGTQFDVRWTPEQDAFELDLREGHVEISGCVFGQSYALHAGQRAVASCRQGRLNVGARGEVTAKLPAAAAPATPESMGEHAPAVPSQPSAAGATPAAVSGKLAAPAPVKAKGRSPAPQSRWRALAEAGRYDDALALVRASGFTAECRRADAAELLLLADLARWGRDDADAEKALHLARRRFASSRQAAQAAFALGKLHFDRDAAYAEAAWWFRTYLRERPGGALAREASGRLLEATARSGETAAARELAAQYLRDYPTGPHAALATSLHVH